jgi:outer membrane translocation and assembly module TamA
VLAGRIRYETIQETEDTDLIPINKRLFLGGTNTVRGYGYQKLGPLDASGNPVGGQSALNGNIELRHPIYKKISGVAFIDMGFLGVDPLTFNGDELRFTGGVGLRYDTPVGPLRIDLGYKLNPPTVGDVTVSPVPNPDDDIEDRWKIHFSIGQAF